MWSEPFETTEHRIIVANDLPRIEHELVMLLVVMWDIDDLSSEKLFLQLSCHFRLIHQSIT